MPNPLPFFFALTETNESDNPPLVLWFVNNSDQPMTPHIHVLPILDLNSGPFQPNSGTEYALAEVGPRSAIQVGPELSYASDLCLYCKVTLPPEIPPRGTTVSVWLDRDGSPYAMVPVLASPARRFDV